MPTLINRWRCDACLKEHDSLAKAQACEARGVEGDLGVEIGDHVICSEYGWWNGDNPNWYVVRPAIPESTDHFERRQGYGVIYRVVDVGSKRPHDHALGYLLWSPSGPEGTPRFRTTSADHIDTTKVDAPVDADQYRTPRSFEGKKLKTMDWWHRFQLA